MTYDYRIFHRTTASPWRQELSRAHMTARSHFLQTIATHLLSRLKESRALDGDASSLPGGHHIGEPHAAQVLGHLTVELLHVVAAVGNQHLLHD